MDLFYKKIFKEKMHALIFYLKIIQPSKKNLQTKSLFIVSNISKIKFLIKKQLLLEYQIF